MITRSELAAMIDHTLLRPESTEADLAACVAEARQLGVGAICISPSMLPVPGAGPLVVATVCGFPTGAHKSATKAVEAEQAVADGAAEIDMVLNIGAVLAGDFRRVERDISAVREVVPAALLKVIIESAVLSPDAIVSACRAAESAGADFVKTSTGFHPAGGATVAAVRLMRETVGDRLGVKASGGIRTTEEALAMIDAGATRLGLSASAKILAGFPTGPKPD